MKPIAVIDLYCGIGGFTQGAIEAGAEVILSIDFWDEAVKVHKTNHPTIPCWRMKLGTPTDWKLIKQIIDKYPNHHIHIHGSPPCQALSNASKTDASKGMPLVLHFLDLIEKLKPDSWSMENVVPMRKRLPEGTPSVVLNSADFGVPQTRRRCIAGEGWIAQPTHTKDQWLSVIQVLPHLKDELITHLRGYSRTRPVMKNGVHTEINTPRIPPDGCITLDESSYTVCSGSMELWRMDSGRANAKTTGINPKTGKKEGGSGYLSRSLDNPSYTIMTNPRNIVTHTEEKPTKIRSLTIPETLILQGFNSDYDLTDTKTKKSRWTMVGNAVCPPVGKSIILGVIFNAETE